MMNLLADVNVNTGVGLTATPFIIAGVILVACIVIALVVSTMAKKKKEAEKAARKAAKKAAENEQGDSNKQN